MDSSVKKRSKKAGLSPGSLVHIGRAYTDSARVTVMRYDAASVAEKEIRTPDELRAERQQSGICWINVDGLQDVRLFEEIGALFGLHPLILEDILNTDQRPKAEDFGDYLFIVLKNISNSTNRDFQVEQVSIILGKDFVLSFREKESPLFDPIRERLRTAKGRVRKAGADYLAHHLLDAVVDQYFVVLDDIEQKIERLEDDLVLRTTPAKLQEIHRLKKELIVLRKSLWPLREAIALLERSDSPLITDSDLIYFKDISDHIIAVIDTVDTFRDILAGMLDIYLSSAGIKLNQVMKVLTIIATIFMPLTFLAGIYGMNFKYMPGLDWPWSFFVVWGAMLTIALGMLMLFRRKKWI
ncbi:MAG: magnesium/cobalt transporter CorA [Deltaproteobacteria bacterium]|jgi:magnesium transporter|nr:magnesium/cobalt transporter CorA [Deltaproteobacteria bacterium]